MGSPVIYLFVCLYIGFMCTLLGVYSRLSAMKSHLKEIDQWFTEHKLPNPITVVFFGGMFYFF